MRAIEVVGVSSFDRYPPEVAKRERVGALLDPDVERILSLKPDLVVVYGTQKELITRLDRAGVARFDYQHAGLADITVTIRRLGQRIGRADEADRLAAGIERDIGAIRTQVAGRPRPKTALLFDREPGSLRGMYASAGIGFMHDMLEVAGGADAFGDLQRQSLQLSSETLLARAPEVIIELQSDRRLAARSHRARTGGLEGPACRARRQDRPRAHHRRRSPVDPGTAGGGRRPDPRARPAPGGEGRSRSVECASVRRVHQVRRY